MQNLQTELEFRDPTLEDAPLLVPRLMAAGMQACTYSFTTFFIWRKYYHNRFALSGEHLFLKSKLPQMVFTLPVGGDLGDGVQILMEYAESRQIPFAMMVAGQENVEKLESLFPGKFAFVPAPEENDYLYRSEDLAELKGKKYHGKRNHVAGFSRKFDWQYEALTEDNTPDVVEMTREWCRQKGNCEDAGLQSERCAIREALRNKEELSLTGGVLRVDGKVAAMTFGSPISPDVFDVHIEKALPEYPGAYAVINQEFVRHSCTQYSYINRENDLGIEGLRKAKLSYYPAILLEKYVCTLRKEESV